MTDYIESKYPPTEEQLKKASEPKWWRLHFPNKTDFRQSRAEVEYRKELARQAMTGEESKRWVEKVFASEWSSCMKTQFRERTSIVCIYGTQSLDSLRRVTNCELVTSLKFVQWSSFPLHSRNRNIMSKVSSSPKRIHLIRHGQALHKFFPKKSLL